MVPNSVIHRNEFMWGSTAREFYHTRLLEIGSKDRSQNALAVGLRGFGSGHVLCPGRHCEYRDSCIHRRDSCAI